MYRTQFSYKEIVTGETVVKVNAGVDGKSGIDANAVGAGISALLLEDGKTVKVLSIAVQPVPVAPVAGKP